MGSGTTKRSQKEKGRGFGCEKLISEPSLARILRFLLDPSFLCPHRPVTTVQSEGFAPEWARPDCQKHLPQAPSSRPRILMARAPASGTGSASHFDLRN